MNFYYESTKNFVPGILQLYFALSITQLLYFFFALLLRPIMFSQSYITAFQSIAIIYIFKSKFYILCFHVWLDQWVQAYLKILTMF